jgi:hypothetical protein
VNLAPPETVLPISFNNLITVLRSKAGLQDRGWRTSAVLLSMPRHGIELRK